MFNWFKERRKRKKDLASQLAAEVMSLCEVMRMERVQILIMLFEKQEAMGRIDYSGPPEQRRQKLLSEMIKHGLISAARVRQIKADSIGGQQLQDWLDKPSLITL